MVFEYNVFGVAMFFLTASLPNEKLKVEVAGLSHRLRPGQHGGDEEQKCLLEGGTRHPKSFKMVQGSKVWKVYDLLWKKCSWKFLVSDASYFLRDLSWYGLGLLWSSMYLWFGKYWQWAVSLIASSIHVYFWMETMESNMWCDRVWCFSWMGPLLSLH